MTEQERAEKAKDLWEHPAFIEARDAVRQGILDAWATSPVADREGQHELRLMLKLLDDLEGNILRFIADGSKARFDIERSALQKARRLVRGYL